MKKFIAAGLMLASLNVFSQSYLVLSNGVTLTIDKAGFIYDFNHFRLPYKVSITGGQFLVEDEKLSTVDASGFLFEKSYKVKKVKGNGLNYFITDDNKLVTIDSNGFYYEYEEDSKIFKRTVFFGGNFFVTNPKKKEFDLYTINDKGNYFKIDLPGLNPRDIISAGGMYFKTNSGKFFTVSKDGLVFEKPEMRPYSIVKHGGNYFIDSRNNLYTISEAGFLLLPVLPNTLRVKDIQQAGANYMIDSKGRIFTVDSLGFVNERTINHDLTSTKILSR